MVSSKASKKVRNLPKKSDTLSSSKQQLVVVVVVCVSSGKTRNSKKPGILLKQNLVLPSVTMVFTWRNTSKNHAILKSRLLATNTERFVTSARGIAVFKEDTKS